MLFSRPFLISSSSSYKRSGQKGKGEIGSSHRKNGSPIMGLAALL
jgi:hypothetical protein